MQYIQEIMNLVCIMLSFVVKCLILPILYKITEATIWLPQWTCIIWVKSVLAKQPWRLWVNTSHACTSSTDDITRKEQSITKPGVFLWDILRVCEWRLWDREYWPKQVWTLTYISSLWSPDPISYFGWIYNAKDSLNFQCLRLKGSIVLAQK